ncbi:MAG: HK97 gp10 family phage protein [Burkholderiaceae bacterium]|nr:HK97 gp10 family phage protein [Burkholderiaceae bacterium]
MNEINIRGLKELQELLNTLPAKIEKNILRSALNQGSKVIAAQAKQNASVKSGFMKGRIHVTNKATKKQRQGTGTVQSFVRVGSSKQKWGVKDAWYGRLVENGTKRHLITGSHLNIGGKFVGKIIHPGAKARPFLRPAFESESSAAVSAVAAHIKKRLTKEGLNTADIETGEQ